MDINLNTTIHWEPLMIIVAQEAKKRFESPQTIANESCISLMERARDELSQALIEAKDYYQFKEEIKNQ